MQIFYFDIAHAIEVHDYIIAKSGGIGGVLDVGRLESVLEHIKNDGYYPTFIDKLTHLFFSINKNHAFNDGNKRTSIALSAYFLVLNGYDYCASTFISKTENITVWVADNAIPKSLLKNIMLDIIMEETREETQLALIAATATKYLQDNQ